MKNLIKVDNRIGIPKYRQIINSVFSLIQDGQLKRGDKIPSINSICNEFSLSRDTVLMAFNELKAKGIVSSVPGKGYYIESTSINVEQKVFVLFDELNAFKEDLYASFQSSLSNNVSVDIFFHHFNYKVFKNLIREAVGQYTAYVIMPATFDHSNEVLELLPKDKVFILDRKKEDLSGYPGVYQDFEKDVYEAMEQGEELLRKYRKLIMVYPGGKEPAGRIEGFRKFCQKKNFDCEIIVSVDERKIEEGEVYFIPGDKQLVKMIKKIRNQGLKLGDNFGIVSFNDSLLKEVVAHGVTTISTDFTLMGEKLATMILENKGELVRNPSAMIVRNSL